MLDRVVAAARLPLEQQCLGAALVGHLVHVGYFVHWTCDTEAFNVLVGHIVAFLLLLLGESSAEGPVVGIVMGFVAFAAYLMGLFTSIVVYRIFFHPLRRFPGPFMAKITKFYAVYAQRHGKIHEVYDQLLGQYGEFVRIGPNEVVHLSLDCLKKVHGPNAKCLKGNLYTVAEYGPHRILNLDNIDDKTVHRHRRQVWEKGFNEVFKVGELHIISVMYGWQRKVDGQQGQAIDWSLFSSLISFDILGRIGFTADFGSVQAEHKTDLQQHIQAMFQSFAVLGNVPWVMYLMTRLQLLGETAELTSLGKQLVAERRKNPITEDIVKYFLEDYISHEPRSFFTLGHVECDAMAILTGAANSTSATLTFCLRHLILNPDVLENLRKDLAPLYGKSRAGEFIHGDLASAVYLDAVINETLRLYSPTCANGPKETPAEGIFLDGTYIPGHVSLVSSIWSFQRSAKFFVRPLDWVPERWTTQPELVLDRRAFHPFSVGPFDCVAKRLATMMLRMVIAYTVWRCDVRFGEDEDGMAAVEESRNEIFLKPGPLLVEFSRRIN